MITLFQKLCDHLIKTVPGLALVDLNTGQLNHFCETAPMETPAVLLELSAPNIDEIDSEQDMVTMQITVRVVLDNSIGETSSITPMQWRQKALDRLNIIDDVTTAIRGYSTAEISALSRNSSVNEERNDSLFVQNITFTGSYIEVF